jgi:hypothetical protein
LRSREATRIVLSWRNSVNRKSPPVTAAAPAPIDAEVTASRRYSAPTVKRSSGDVLLDVDDRREHPRRVLAVVVAAQVMRSSATSGRGEASDREHAARPPSEAASDAGRRPARGPELGGCQPQPHPPPAAPCPPKPPSRADSTCDWNCSSRPSVAGFISGSAQDLALGGLDGGAAGREHEAAGDAHGEETG